MDLPTLMDTLCAQLRVEPMPADASGAYGLRFGDTTVNLRPVPPSEAFALQACLGRVRFEDPQMLQALLADNLLPAQGSNAALGLDGEGQVHLTEHISLARADIGQVQACLTRFVSRARAWQRRLTEGQA